MHLIKEGKARIKIALTEKISKEMPVFYNPVMEANRSISVLVLNSIDKKDMQIASPLAASGIREIRFLLELDKGKIKSIALNDYSAKAISAIKSNLRLNKIKPNKNKITISKNDANLFLLDSSGFDYIDIDPFGSPNKFLDSAVKRLSRDGILAVTATDTAPLCGTYPKTCIRKYWAVPLRNELMHELGLRILIRKVQLVASQYDKALTPIFSYYKDHYFRIFFQCEKSKAKCDKLVAEHGMFNNAGPLWLGKLWDEKLVGRMCKNNKDPKLDKFLLTIKNESKISTIGFYNIHKLCKKYRLMVPKKELIIKKIRQKGFKASATHFAEEGVKSDIEEKQLVRLIKN